MSKKEYNQASKVAKLKKQSEKYTRQMHDNIKKTALYSAVIAGSIGFIRYYNGDENTITHNEIIKPVEISEVQKNYDEINPVMVDIDEMLKDYNSAVTLDEVKQVNKYYSNQYIEIEGEIKREYIDSIDGTYITLKGEKAQLMSVQCELADEEQIKKLNELEKGDEITVQGYCIGGSGLSVKLEDCMIK